MLCFQSRIATLRPVDYSLQNTPVCTPSSRVSSFVGGETRRNRGGTCACFLPVALGMALLARLFGDVATVTYPARMAGCELQPETEIDGQESLCRLLRQSFGKIVEVKECALLLAVSRCLLLRCIPVDRAPHTSRQVRAKPHPGCPPTPRAARHRRKRGLYVVPCEVGPIHAIHLLYLTSSCNLIPQ